MDIFLDVSEEQYEKIKKFNPSLGYNALSIATMLAPYDTGNLRTSIKLTKNTNKEIRITYDLLMANYIQFLELGQGSVKKHKGFIENATVSAIMESLVLFCQDGYIAINSMPINALKTSNKLFSAEKRILNQMNMKTNSLNADVRQKISMIREASYQSSLGNKVKTTKGITLESFRRNKGYRRQNVSELHKQYVLIKENRLL